MLKKHPILVSLTVLLLTSLACSQATPAAPLDSNALSTSIAQTVEARQTEAALNNPVTATLTSEPFTPTFTLEPTLSATPDYTPTSETPLISVSVDTNCRTGPGSIYKRVGILLVGETAEIVGREPRGEYWYIRNPDAADEGIEFCWVWGEYADVTGNLLPLLFLSPPPPDEVSFDLSYVKLEKCSSTWWVDFKLVNSSGVVFKSISLSVSDTNTLTVTSLDTNGFTHKDGCDTTNTIDSLVTGGTTTVSSAPFGYNPSGHTLAAKVTLCTSNDATGTCVKKELTFTP